MRKKGITHFNLVKNILSVVIGIIAEKPQQFNTINDWGVKLDNNKKNKTLNDMRSQSEACFN